MRLGHRRPARRRPGGGVAGVAERPHGARPAPRRPHPPRRRRRARSRRWPRAGRATPPPTAFRFELATGRHLQRAAAPVTPQDVIASLERVMAAGDSSLAALSLEAVKGFRAFADGEAEHVERAHRARIRDTVRIELTTPLVGAARRAVEPGAVGGGRGDDRRVTWATSTSAARGRWRRPRTSDLELERRDDAARASQHVELRRPRRPGGGLRRLRGRRRRLGRGARRPATTRRSRSTATTPSPRSRPSCSSG